MYFYFCTFLGTLGEQEGIDFPDVCRYWLGRWGEYVGIAFSIITLLGAAIVYWVLMANFLFNSVEFIYGKIICFSLH